MLTAISLCRHTCRVCSLRHSPIKCPGDAYAQSLYRQRLSKSHIDQQAVTIGTHCPTHADRQAMISGTTLTHHPTHAPPPPRLEGLSSDSVLRRCNVCLTSQMLQVQATPKTKVYRMELNGKWKSRIFSVLEITQGLHNEHVQCFGRFV